MTLLGLGRPDSSAMIQQAGRGEGWQLPKSGCLTRGRAHREPSSKEIYCVIARESGIGPGQ